MKKRYGFLLETVMGIAVLVFINAMWFGHNMGFIGISPNPYWIIVAFIAARYGSLQGFLAGVLCSLALLFSVSYNISLDQQFEFARIPYKQLQVSALFILIGFLLGEERSRVERMLKSWIDKYNTLRNEYSDLAMEHVALKNVNTELEGRILGQVDTVNTVYEVARDLVTLQLDRLYPSIVGLVQKFIAPEKCSFYLWEDGRFVLKGQGGWDVDMKKRKALDADSDIIRKAVADNRTVTVSDIFKTEKLKWKQGKDPVMAAPLYFGEQKELPAGLIVIDEMSFLKLNPNSVRFMAIMSDWISNSLDKALATTAIRRKDVFDEDLKLFNYNYAMRRLKEEFLSVKVSGKPSSFVFVKMNEFDKIEEKRKRDVLRAAGFVISHTLRAGDTVAKYLGDDTFITILSGTDLEGAGIAGNRIKEEIEKFDFRPYGEEGKKLKVDVRANLLDPKYDSETEILNVAEKSKK